MATNDSNRDLTLARLCGWATGYALRRWAPLVTVIASLLFKIGLDVLKPWPMVFLINYLDHQLRGNEMPQVLRSFIEWLPGAPTPETLIACCVAATVLIFLLSWAVGLATAYGNISLGQRMT